MHAALKEHLLKKLINFCMMLIDKLVPDVRPYYPQTKMAERLFEQFLHVYRLEVWCGRFDDVPYQTLKGLEDRNFQHFLSAIRKILLYLGENDRYYRAWIGLAFILAHGEYHRALEGLTQEEFVASYLEQWELRFGCIGPNHFQLHKSQFLDMMLAAHLPNLLRETIPKKSCPQSKKQSR
jgi:hypothetical protein